MKTHSSMRQQLPVVLVAGLGGFFTVVDIACAQPWATTTAPKLSWKALASSADGTTLAAAANTRGGYFALPPAPIYVSTNAGATWIQTSTPSNIWTSVAASADGAKLVAVATTLDPYCGGGDGLIYTSPDSGTTWMRTSAPSNTWTSVASSADGARLVAVAAPQWNNNLQNYVGDGTIYRSLDSGATWSRTGAPTNFWTTIACSAGGTDLVAAAGLDSGGDGSIYSSLDSGATWSWTSAPPNDWASVASSADGTKLVAVAGPRFVGDGLIYISSDLGATWIQTSAPYDGWSAVASSADGTKLVAAAWHDNSGNLGQIYASSNSGVSWMATGAPPGRWTALASSADGYRVVAASDFSFSSSSDSICTMPYPPLPPSPQLAVGLSATTLDLSWLVPSSRFVLQQNSDFGSTNWVDMPTSPTFDYTNLHQRVTLMPSLGSSFYRLKQQ